jgi:hypothetical protein
MKGPITSCRIFPGIGVARLGNSPEHFVGPEAPGRPFLPEGGYKDRHGRVKRQAARFRIYGYDAAGQVVGEITAAEGDITWTVHLANKKAGWHEFKSRYYPDSPLRNPTVQPNLPPDERTLLNIDPGPRSIRGANVSGPEYQFDTGRIGPLPVPGVPTGLLGVSPASSAAVVVPLGEVRTDEAGRLLVLGGEGSSGSILDGNPITDYANNDYWYDDTADGPVTATVTLKDGGPVPVQGGAWVLCAPPHFATNLECLTTLYDLMEQAGGVPLPLPPSFTRDVYPILARLMGYTWVNATVLLGHGPGRAGHFVTAERLAVLSDKSEKARLARHKVFQRIRNPALIPDHRIPADKESVPRRDKGEYPYDEAVQADGMFMPAMAGDYGWDGPVEQDPTTWMALIPRQYTILQAWDAGKFVSDWPGAIGPPVPPPFHEIPLAGQPAALTRAALERCIGGPFYPGIEITYIAGDPTLYAEPFRFRDDLRAGDITRYMALPWQADYFECNTYWWPSARPDDVVPGETYLEVAAQVQQIPGYVLTAAKLDELRQVLPKEVVAQLMVLQDQPFSARRDYVGALIRLLGEKTFLLYNTPLLVAGRTYDLGALLGEARQRRQWARGVGGPDDIPAGDNRMVERWYRLGFVVPVVGPNGDVAYVELERDGTLRGD